MHPNLAKLARRSSRLARNITLDLKYGGFLGGRKPTSHPELGAAWVVSTDYALMPQIFEGRIKESDVLVDVGCGKGRVINWWMDRGYRNKIVGIEWESDIAEKARRRLSRFENVTIVSGNAIDHLPEDGTVFYLFNPFTETLMTPFKDRLWEMFGNRGGVTVLYYAPVFIGVFKDDPHWEVEEIELNMAGVAGNHHDRHHQLAVIRVKDQGIA